MSGRWWRAYDGAVDDPKIQQLRPELFKAWFNLCCVTSQNNGVLPPLAAIAFKLRAKPEKVRSMIGELTALGLIDVTDKGLTPHNWDVRQYRTDGSDPTAADRMKRYRDRKRNATVTHDRNAQRN